MKSLLFSFLKKLARCCPDFLTDIARIPGITALYEFLYQKTKPQGVILIECEGNKMCVNTEDRYIAPLLIMQAYERQQTQLLKGLLKPGMVVLDIGANIGYYALIMAHVVGPSGKIYAFEPEPRNYDLLVMNVSLNGYTNIITVQKAVSNRHGKAKLFLDDRNLGGHSLSIGDESAESIEVETTTVDDFLREAMEERKIDIVRMDVEGAEGLVIEGASHALEDSHIKVILEFCPRQLRNLGTDPRQLLRDLRDLGFRIIVIDEFNRSIRSIEGMDIIKACEEARYDHLDLFLERVKP